jgi:hypothetical protein
MIKNQSIKSTIFSPIYVIAVIFLISSCVTVIALRSNNYYMGTLRSQVYLADKNNNNVVGALERLQAYVTHNMNTSLTAGNDSVYPPIQLKYTYERLLEQESKLSVNNNASLYTDAQNYCQTVIPNAFSGRTRVPCIENYIESHSNQLPKVSPSLYEFDFISPNWSPDLAGYSLIATILSFLGLIVAIIFRMFRKLT